MKRAVSRFPADKRTALTGKSRTSNGHGADVVYRRLRDRGSEVIAVNPNAGQIEGDVCHPDLKSVPDCVEAVVNSTRPKTAEPTMRECVTRGTSQVWMHRGPGAEKDPGTNAR